MYPTDNDLAEDELNKIKRLKEDLVRWLDECHNASDFYNNRDSFREWDKEIEELFDDKFIKQWWKHYKVGVSIDFTVNIPSCEMLRLEMAKEKMKARMRPLKSYTAFGSGSGGVQIREFEE